jgi:hypothetical protein
VVFLDVKKKTWNIRDLEIPVIENIPMKEMLWFREKIKWSSEQEQKGTLTTGQALKIDEEWWDNIAKVGLDTTVDKILDTGITESEFRELMAEVYNFLSQLGTIEKAKQFVLYDPKIQKKDDKQ